MKNTNDAAGKAVLLDVDGETLTFLQFLYDLNVICFIERTEEGKPHIHWCFRDRTYSNISPKVKLGETYEIFYGMSKALNTGKKLSRGKA